MADVGVGGIGETVEEGVSRGVGAKTARGLVGWGPRRREGGWDGDRVEQSTDRNQGEQGRRPRRNTGSTREDEGGGVRGTEQTEGTRRDMKMEG